MYAGSCNGACGVQFPPAIVPFILLGCDCGCAARAMDALTVADDDDVAPGFCCDGGDGDAGPLVPGCYIRLSTLRERVSYCGDGASRRVIRTSHLLRTVCWMPLAHCVCQLSCVAGSVIAACGSAEFSNAATSGAS
jgi:hypothetical protein